jgi:hypothetical protein
MFLSSLSSFSYGSELQKLPHLSQDESLLCLEFLSFYKIIDLLLFFKWIFWNLLDLLKLDRAFLSFKTFFYDLSDDIVFELTLELELSLVMIVGHGIGLFFMVQIFKTFVMALDFNELLKLIPIMFSPSGFELKSPGSGKG